MGFKLFQLVSAEIAFRRRLSDAEDAIAELRRLVRQQDLDVSNALETIQRLSARLAKRVYRAAEGETPESEPLAPRTSSEAANARILARRRQAAAAGQVPPLAAEAGNGLLPNR